MPHHAQPSGLEPAGLRCPEQQRTRPRQNWEFCTRTSSAFVFDGQRLVSDRYAVRSVCRSARQGRQRSAHLLARRT